MEIKKIVLPTNFSEGASVALPYAVDMAKNYGAKLYVIHVIHDIVKASGWYIPHITMDEVYTDIENSAKKEIERFGLEEVRGLKDIERVVVKGVPYDEIIKFASDNKADIIIMGTHGRKGLDRVLFGSTAEKVVRNAPCPVLTVRIPMHME